MSAGWNFYIDRGGTFTDVIGCSPEGELHVGKVLSENPGSDGDAVLAGIIQILNQNGEDSFSRDSIHSVRMGTTVGTNALLEKKGSETAFVTTKGFGDVLRIGYQNRPNIFAFDISVPEVPCAATVEVEERMRADGSVHTKLDSDRCRVLLQELKDQGIDSIAITLLHSYKNASHEHTLAALAREVGFSNVSVSSLLSPTSKIVVRGETALLDAYITPILSQYIEILQVALPEIPLFCMQSNGGLVRADRFRGKDCILSGPAGGIVGAVSTSEALGFEEIISFDMGGTSTDVAHYSGRMERIAESDIDGVKVRAPMLRIETIAAGGGSVVSYKDGRYQVGPESAGADPGPACYKNGGPLTVTDCNVFLGRIQPETFPRVFGPSGTEALDTNIVDEKFTQLAHTIAQETGVSRSKEEIAEGFLRIALDNMAQAIRGISIQQGHDIRRHALCCFGGAGGQHACELAALLDMKTVLIHPLAGVLSAFGMGLAPLRSMKECSVQEPLTDAVTERLNPLCAELRAQAVGELEAQGVEPDATSVRFQLYVRYKGIDSSLLIDYAHPDTVQEEFEALHRKQFGFCYEDTEIIIDTLVCEAEASPPLREMLSPERIVHESSQVRSAPVPVWLDGAWRSVPLISRGQIPIAERQDGPALIAEETSTTLVPVGWSFSRKFDGTLVMTHESGIKEGIPVSEECDPVLLELFNNAFRSAAERMGAQLQKTSYSVNIKERLDFSCAIFDRHGNLVANAPHIPVHLGSMSESVRGLISRLKGSLTRGDAYMLNDPYGGGTHLPDITVVSPVFFSNDVPSFYVASRAHHADVGGISPGSMPAESTQIDEEGVLIRDLKILERGVFREDVVRGVLSSARYPARNIAQNTGDLRAQLAANETGIEELRTLVAEYGEETIHRYMEFIQDNAARCVRRLFPDLHPGVAEQHMDCGARVRCAVRLSEDQTRLIVDFSGTSSVLSSNFNAPIAICKAVVMYGLRCMIQDEIPLNEGCLRPVEIIIPDQSMLAPEYPAAVAAGNVETSQVLIDCFLEALSVLANSQGTMNNLTFGNETYQYYETICGGTGAGPGFHGASAVHSHMTNSRLTDPEILELRYPIRVVECKIRRDSGGAGRFHGGDGICRRLQFTEPLAVSIISNRRRYSASGIQGGSSGRPGRNILYRKNGEQVQLDSVSSFDVQAGDELQIETPGGGGFGSGEKSE